jgi:hypothetical protein
MFKSLPLTGLLCIASLFANAAEAPAPDCERLREQIRAQTGILPKPDTDLLQKLGSRPECRFSAAEVYRAAYGDKPLPKKEARSYRKHDHDDD